MPSPLLGSYNANSSPLLLFHLGPDITETHCPLYQTLHIVDREIADKNLGKGQIEF